MHRASADDFHLYPQSYEVTKVSMLLKIFNKKSKVARLQRLRGLHRASADDFHWYPQSYEVTKVSMLLKIFNKKQKLQGCRGYGGCTGLLLKIFTGIPKVTRL